MFHSLWHKVGQIGPRILLTAQDMMCLHQGLGKEKHDKIENVVLPKDFLVPKEPSAAD